MSDEADNEIVRRIFRKRANIYMRDDDPFEDWAKVFSVDGHRYWLSRRHTQYGVRYTFFSRGPSAFDKDKTWFRPDDHLMHTLWDVIEQRSEEQYATEKSKKTAEILA